MKLGIGTYAYMWSIGFPGAEPTQPMDALGLLATARALGVKVVQYGPNLDLTRLPDGELELVIGRARDWGIELEVGARGLETGHLRKYISIARRAGATLLRSVPELASGEIPSPEEIGGYLRCIEPELAAAGVRLALENANIPAAHLAQVLDRAGSPWIGVTLDTVNSLAIPEGTEHVARTLARHTMCLHVKDFVVRRVWHMMGFTVEGRPAGQGQLDVPWMLDLIRGEGRSPNAILELWPPEQKTLEETIRLEQAWVLQSIPYLRRYLPD